MIVVDSSVWIDRFQGRTSDPVERLRGNLSKEVVVVGDIVLLEVLQGARDDLHARKLHQLLAAFRLVEMLDANIALKCAANYRHLRARGVTIRTTADLVIGTWCIENNASLLHNDRDFLPMVDHLGLVAL